MQIEAKLRDYIVREHLHGEDPDCLGIDDELIDSGILDSLAVVQLVGHVERHFGIPVDMGDITTDNFSTIKRLAAFVRSGA